MTIALNQVDTEALGSEPYVAKAWVNFNGTGTVSIRDSYNVSSITDEAGGRYRVNFGNALNNANYSVNLSCSTQNSGNSGMFAMTNTQHTGSPSSANNASYFWVTTVLSGSLDAGESDSPYIHAQVFGG